MYRGAETAGGGAVVERKPARPVISTRGGSGLGDAIYLQSVTRHFIGQGYFVEACSDWPDVFRPLGDRVRVSPFRRDVDRNAHYSMRRGLAGTTQFQDCCIQAGIKEPVEFTLGWSVQNANLAFSLRSHGKPVIVVQMPRPPFARTDGFGAEFLPDCKVIQKIIDRIGGWAFFVLVGKGEPLFQFRGIDLDLTNATSVCDLLDVGCAADAFLGYCSFIVPLAESLSKPALLVWSKRGLGSPHQVVRQMTPQKILHRPSSRFVVDDWPETEIIRAADALCQQIGSPAVV